MYANWALRSGRRLFSLCFPPGGAFDGDAFPGVCVCIFLYLFKIFYLCGLRRRPEFL
jgi:hypothetical protein